MVEQLLEGQRNASPSVSNAGVRSEFGELERFKAVRANEETAEPFEIATLWVELSLGKARMRECFFNDDTCFLAVESAIPSARPERRLLPRKLRVLERVLLRGGQKSVAAELGLAPSTVAIIAGGCLRAMGMDSGASRAPLPLWMALHAFHGNTQYRQARLSRITHGGRTYSIIAVPRPERRLSQLVSPAEYAVLRLLVEGLSHAEMALVRHTSVRTIANQLASAFHKLGVSGRSELLCQLVALNSAFPELPPQRRASSESQELPRSRPVAEVVNG
ncbi:MAG: response regulator transcription factor [Myxococcota bacterium]